MEKNSLDEKSQRALTLCTKLENQARTWAAINRKSLALAEQRKMVGRNFVKTEKEFTRVLIDLNSSIQEEGELTDEQATQLGSILDKIAEQEKSLSSFLLIFRKEN